MNMVYVFTCAGIDAMNVEELSLVVQCRYEQANIALQCQHAVMAARLAVSALKMMVRVHESLQQSAQGDGQPLGGDRSADLHLWLRVKLCLANCLRQQIRGLGELNGNILFF
jgi:hypothetical protein